MVAGDLGPVIHELELILLLSQRAIATIYTQTVAEVAETASGRNLPGIGSVVTGVPHKIGGLAGGEVSPGVESGNADVGCRSGSAPLGATPT